MTSSYDFRCKKCKSEWTLNISKHDVFDVYDNPCPSCGAVGHVEKWVPNPNGSLVPSIGDPVRLGIRKPDNGFKEVLQKIHEGSPGSTLNQKF